MLHNERTSQILIGYKTRPGDLVVLDPFGPFYFRFWTIFHHFGPFGTLLFGPVFLGLSFWACLFGPLYLDLSIWTFPFAPIYLARSIWTRLFGPVYLNLSIGTSIFRPANHSCFQPVPLFATV